MNGNIIINALSKRYSSVVALTNVSLTVPEGQIMAILGPSGSGKSTLLNICAGLTRPTSGVMSIGGVDITHLPAEHRDIGVVFQSYALFPHLSVRENVAFPLRTKRHRTSAEEMYRRADEMLARVRLPDCSARRPSELSGGQQQRVALARALVFRPRLLLLDEPLGALDPQIKQHVQEDIRRLRDEMGVTIIYVTHDQQEAMSIADQIAILHQGTLQQVGAAQTIYDHPANEFVATFVGAGNLVRGRAEALACGAGAVAVNTQLGVFHVDEKVNLLPEGDVLLLVRPEKISLTAVGARPAQMLNQIVGTVISVRFFGAFFRFIVEVTPDTYWIVDEPRNTSENPLALGTQVDLSWRVSDTQVVGTPPPRLLASHAIDTDKESNISSLSSPDQAPLNASFRRHYARNA